MTGIANDNVKYFSLELDFAKGCRCDECKGLSRRQMAMMQALQPVGRDSHDVVVTAIGFAMLCLRVAAAFRGDGETIDDNVIRSMAEKAAEAAIGNVGPLMVDIVRHPAARDLN